MASPSIDAGATRISAADRLRLRLSGIAWFVLFTAFLLSLPILFGAWIWIPPLVVILSLLLAVPVAWMARRLLSGQRRHRRSISFLKAAAGTLFLLSALLAAPVYYFAFNTALHPLTVPQATLSNGTRAVIFQGMVHVGSEDFYKSVIYDIEKAISDGDVIYYEGVVDDPQGDAWFSQTLAGGGDLSTNYAALGDACGLSFQLDYFELLRADRAAHPERHVDADVTTADMMREYQRLERTDPAFATAFAAQHPASASDNSVANGIGRVLDWLHSATDQQRSLIGTACRGWLTLALARERTPSAIDLVVLDYRNRRLAERIAADSHKHLHHLWRPTPVWLADRAPGVRSGLEDHVPEMAARHRCARAPDWHDRLVGAALCGRSSGEDRLAARRGCRGGRAADVASPGRVHPGDHLNAPRCARRVGEWKTAIGLTPEIMALMARIAQKHRRSPGPRTIWAPSGKYGSAAGPLPPLADRRKLNLASARFVC